MTTPLHAAIIKAIADNPDDDALVTLVDIVGHLILQLPDDAQDIAAHCLVEAITEQWPVAALPARLAHG